MSIIAARIAVAADGTISGHAPDSVPPGERPISITLWAPPAVKPFSMDGWPSHDLGWDDSVSLRR